MERWGARIHVPRKDLLGWLCYDPKNPHCKVARMCGVQLCAAILATGEPLYSLAQDGHLISEDNFYAKLADNLLFEAKDVACATAETVGMCLAQLGSKSTALDDRTTGLNTMVCKLLLGLGERSSHERMLLLLRHISLRYPPIVDQFLPGKLLSAWRVLSSESSIMVLEMVAMRAEFVASKVFYSLHSQIHTSLIHFNDLQRAALLNVACRFIPYQQLDENTQLLNKWLVPLSERVNSFSDDCRVLFYNTCIVLYDHIFKELPQEGQNALARIIIRGIDDSSLIVRDIIVRFWDAEQRMSIDAFERTLALFTRLLPPTTSSSSRDGVGSRKTSAIGGAGLHRGGSRLAEDSSGVGSTVGAAEAWMQYASCLLLYLAHRSPDFNRADYHFPQPLQNCPYRPLEVHSSFVSDAPLVPMFSSQGSVAGRGPSEVALGSGLEAAALSQALNSSRIIMTQQRQQMLAFTPTIETSLVGAFEPSVFRQFPKTSTQLLFSNSQSISAAAIPSGSQPRSSGNATGGGSSETTSRPFLDSMASAVRLRRRFNQTADDEGAIRRHIMFQQQQKKWATSIEKAMDPSGSTSSSSKRSGLTATIKSLRRYRDGEVPDIQVSLQGFIVPLQALCLFDSELATLCFTAISRELLRHLRDVTQLTPSANSGPSVGHTLFSSVVSVSHVDSLRELERDLWGRIVGLSSLPASTPSPTSADPCLLRYSHEMMLSPLCPMSAFGNIADFLRGSQAESTETSTLLVLEKAMMKRRASGVNPSPVDWVSLYLLHRSTGDPDSAGQVAKRFNLEKEAIAALRQSIDAGFRGDGEESVQKLDQALRVAERSKVATKEEREALLLEKRAALAAMLRWGEVTASFDPKVYQGQSQVDFTGGTGLPWIAGPTKLLFVKSHLQYTDDSRRRLREYFHDHPTTSSSGFDFERSLLEYCYKDYAAASSIASAGTLRLMTTSGKHQASGSSDGAVALGGPLSPSNCRTMAKLCTLTVAGQLMQHATQMAPSAFFSEASKIIQPWVHPPDTLARSPTQWEELYLLRTAVKGSFQSVPVSKRFDEDTPGAEEARIDLQVFERLAKPVLFNLCQTAAANLARSGSACAIPTKRFLESLTQLASAAKGRLVGAEKEGTAQWLQKQPWNLFIRNSIVRAVAGKERLGPKGLRDTFALIQVELKKEKDLETAPATKHGFSLLAGDFWANLTEAVLEVESPNAALENEFKSWTEKAIGKYAKAAEVGSPVRTDALLKSAQFARAVCVAFSDDNHIASAELKNRLAAHSVRTIVDAVKTVGNRSSRFLFPNVLFLARTYPEAAKILEDSAADLPPYAVLPWCAQMLSSLLFPLAVPAVGPLLLRVAAHYPNDVYFPFQCIEDELEAAAEAAAGRGNAELQNLTERIRGTIGAPLRATGSGNQPPALAPAAAARSSKSALQRFSDAIHLLQYPESRLKEWWSELKKEVRVFQNPAVTDPAVKAVHVKAALRIWNVMKADCLDPTRPDLGTYNRDFAESCGKKKFQDLFMQSGRFDPQVAEIDKFMAKLSPPGHTAIEVLRLAADLPNLLQDRSHGAGIELPRQPFYHLESDVDVGVRTLIVAVDPVMEVLQSKEKPKKLVLFTNTGSMVTFLVKGGDDMRLDQRVQQIFQFVNQEIRQVEITAASSSALTPSRAAAAASPWKWRVLRTYSVVPLSKRMGLAEWVPHTESLKASIHRSMLQEALGTAASISTVGAAGGGPAMPAAALVQPQVQKHPAIVAYLNFINALDPATGEGALYAKFLKAYRKVDDSTGVHTARVQGWINSVNPDYLKDALASLCSLRVDYYTKREYFIGSHATVCMVSYILGVGDRHLDNSLLDCRTGQAVAIDFGHCFGSATELPIPELIPFRLTPQITNIGGVLQSDRYAPGMLAVLQLLQKRKSDVEGFLSAFISEPLLHWAIKDKSFQQGVSTAQSRIQVVKRKLRLENPVQVLKDELKSNLYIAKEGVMPQIHSVLDGQLAPRLHTGKPTLTPTEFVDVLISVATDENILGRTWAHWSPFF